MAAGKKSFVLYHDIRTPLELLTDEQRGKLFIALLNYSEYGELPDFDGALLMAFAFIRTSLDRDAEAWAEKRAKRAEAGRSGGLAKAANASNASSSKQNVANLAVPVSVSVPVPVNVNTPNTSVGRETADKPPRASRFTPPTVDEVRAYCQERGSSVDPEKFVDFYSANGWKQGRNKPIVDWKAAVRTWERSDAQQKAQDRNRIRSYDADESFV